MSISAIPTAAVEAIYERAGDAVTRLVAEIENCPNPRAADAEYVRGKRDVFLWVVRELGMLIPPDSITMDGEEMMPTGNAPKVPE